MPEIVSDALKPYETPIEGANEIYLNQTNPGYGAYALGTFEKAGTLPAARAAVRGTQADASWYDRALAEMSVDPTPEATSFGLARPTTPAEVTPTLQPEEYNERYAPRDIAGKIIPIGDKPMSEGLAKIIGQQKTESVKRDSVLARFYETHSGLTSFAVGTAVSMLDPLNAALLLVPPLGEGAILARVGAGFLGRTTARLGAGATTGALITLPQIGMHALLDPEEASEYGMRDALHELFYGAAGFAAFHAGFGVLRDVYRTARGIPLEGAAAPPPTAGGPDAATTNAIMRSGIAQIKEGREFDISNYFPPRADTAIGLAMEAPRRVEIVGEANVEAQARRLAPELFARYDALTQRAAELRTRLFDPEATFGREIDGQIAALRARAEAARSDIPPVNLRREELAARVAEQTRVYEEATKAADALAGQRAGLIHAHVAAARLDHADIDAQLRDIAGTGELAKARANAEAIVGVRDRATEIEAAARAPAPPAPPLEGGIAGDMARRIMAGGRPEAEANEMGALVQSLYEQRAKLPQYAGLTAEDLYRLDHPDVAAGEAGEERLGPGELGQAPSEIKGHPEGEAEDAVWRKLEPETTAAGAYRGAPANVTTRRGLTRLRQQIRQLVLEGAPGRFWYEDSARAVLRITRGNLEDAERFIGLLAIYSPQMPVFGNNSLAIKAFEQWKRGEPINVKTGAQDAKAQAWLYRGEDWGGRKTHNFYLNLMHDVITEHPEAISRLNLPPDVLAAVKGATVDLWVLRALGYGVDSAGGVGEGAGNKYGFAERELQRLAGYLNRDLPEGAARWLPHQVQAALWSAVKARYELPSVKEATWLESIDRGFAKLEPDENGVLRRAAPSKSGPEKQGHMAIWHKHAMAAPAEEVARQVEIAKGSFGDAIGRVAQNVTGEVIPTSFAASIGHPIAGAGRAAKERLTREGLALITDDDGNDVLAAQLGVNLNYSRFGAGMFEGDINPTVVTTLVPEKPPGIFDATKARQYARAWQFIFRQDAVPIFRSDHAINFAGDYGVRNNETGAVRRFDTQRKAQAYADQLAASGKQATVSGRKFASGVHLEFAADLNEAAQWRLAHALDAELGKDVGFTKTGDREATIINYRYKNNLPSIDDEDFGAAIRRIAARADLGVKQTSHFGSEGEYGPVHDWRADPTGGSLPEASGGSPAFQAWLRDRHQAFGRLLDEWSDPARIAAADRDAAATGARAAEPGTRAGAAEPGAGPSPRGPPGEPAELEQAGRGKIRLATETARALITLFRDADASTFLHEFAHHAAQQFFLDAAHPLAPAQLRADAEALSRWLGRKEGQTRLTRAQQEQLAQGFEQYTMEGKAPAPELNNVFAKLRDWMVKIYRDATALGVPINDEVRGVFDRWFAAPEETGGIHRSEINLDGKPTTIEGPAPPPAGRAPDLIDLAIRQRAEQRAGWAPAMSAPELAAANDAVYGPRAAAAPAPAPAPRPGEPRGPAEAPPQLEELEAQVARIPPEAIHPDDRAMLEQSAEAVQEATAKRSIYETAAACILGLAA